MFLGYTAGDLVEGGEALIPVLDRLIGGVPAPDRPLLIPPAGVMLRRSTDLTAISIRNHLREKYRALDN